MGEDGALEEFVKVQDDVKKYIEIENWDKVAESFAKWKYLDTALN